MLRNIDKFDQVEVEKKVLDFWEKNKIFEKSLNKKGKEYVFYEGPPTANGKPGIHHVVARCFKDIIPRYKTMRGYRVPRKAGWDTHGLPVELQAEKELGLSNKQDIEKYGIGKFNQYCKELIWRFKDEFEYMTKRMGYWIDLKNPYVTYKNAYIESVWWVFSQINKKGYVKKMLRTVPWCTRCQTPLSSHELGQPGAYKEVTDPSLFFKVLLKKKYTKDELKEYLLVWTTTPWTLTANLAVAVNSKLEYGKYEILGDDGSREYLYSYNKPEDREGFKVSLTTKIKGSKLVGLSYEPLFKLPEEMIKELKKAVKEHKNKPELYVTLSADFVSTKDGSGLVHMAPSFGEEDFKVFGLRYGLPQTVDDKGHLVKGVVGAGRYVKAADKDIVLELEKRGLLYHSTTIEHEYPHCWRCDTPLLYMVRDSWFIQMSKVNDQMVKNNKKINWVPGHIKTGRFGQWIGEGKDWSISRNRYWGTPLPIWECTKKSCDNRKFVGSIDELFSNTKNSGNTYFGLRHGEATHNAENKNASGKEGKNTTSQLTAKGEKQILEVAEKLKKEKINLIVASPYYRTQQTAKILSKVTKAKIVTDKRLGEIDTGIFNWKSVDSYHEYFASVEDRFVKAPQGAETLTEVRARMVEALKDLEKKHKNKRIVIVSHGDSLWLLEGAVRGLDNEGLIASEYYPNHTSYVKIQPPSLPINEVGEVDLHRPYIDKVVLRCSSCSSDMKRVSDVGDVWFDPGSMPYAQSHFPFSYGGGVNTSTKKLAELYKKISFPADYIAEGVDQTRGWFYVLLAISTLLGKGIPYKNVICLGLVNDKNGKKMSKSKGNIVDPIEIMDKHGADMLRWYFYTINSPGESKNFDEDELSKLTRRFLLIMYNSFVFWNSYAEHNEDIKRSYKPEHVLDKWILAKLQEVIKLSTEKLDEYEVGEGARIIESFVDDLSRWYIRRSRNRFQDSARGLNIDSTDWNQASNTLRIVLETLSKLTAPLMPFFSEALYKSVGGSLESVHLDSWPEVKNEYRNTALVKDMDLVRSLATAGLSLRSEKGIKVRQPLSSLTIRSITLKDKKELIELLKDEVNVREVLFDIETQGEVDLDTVLTPELVEAGLVREFVRLVQGLRADAKYHMSDEIVLMVSGNSTDFVQRNSGEIKRLVNAKQIVLDKKEKADAYLETNFNKELSWIGVKKI